MHGLAMQHQVTWCACQRLMTVPCALDREGMIVVVTLFNDEQRLLARERLRSVVACKCIDLHRECCTALVYSTRSLGAAHISD
jgi:hypothetical protein